VGTDVNGKQNRESSNISLEQVKIVAIDGPAGSGKSTICKMVGEKLGWDYVSTGKLYRAIGLLAQERGLDLEDDNGLVELANEFGEFFTWVASTDEIFFKERNLSEQLYSVEAGAAASTVAKQPKFRDALLPVQRKMASFSEKGALFDGRDVGTIVFPDANCKIYMTASLQKRAERRLKQLELKSETTPSLEQLMSDIEARDRQDSNRGVAPLLQAEDAVFFDTSEFDLNQSVDKVVEIIKLATK
jgi:CMP/dCMP kinase